MFKVQTFSGRTWVVDIRNGRIYTSSMGKPMTFDSAIEADRIAKALNAADKLGTWEAVTV